MKHLILLLFLSITLSSCQDDFNMNQIDSKNQLVVYSFPSKDGIQIQVSFSKPIFGKETTRLQNVKVACMVNGEKRIVQYIRNDNLGLGNPDRLIYQVIGKIQAKDSITIKVSADYLPTAFASSIIPDKPVISRITSAPIHLDGENYTQLRVTIKDNPLTKDYYGIEVVSDKRNEEINTYSEPLLNNYTLGIPAFDSRNHFYHNFYIFDDSGMSGYSIYTLHLNLRSEVSQDKVLLYHISPSLYHYLKSINDQSNNELAKYNMSFMPPIYTIVINGLGVVGGYSATTSLQQW